MRWGECPRQRAGDGRRGGQGDWVGEVDSTVQGLWEIFFFF